MILMIKRCRHYHWNRCVSHQGDSKVPVYSHVLPSGCVSSLLAVWALVSGFLFIPWTDNIEAFTMKPSAGLKACVMSWSLKRRGRKKKCKAFNVQTQAQTWASVSPYADYNEGLIVPTAREGRDGKGGKREAGGVAAAATAVQSHSTSAPSGAGQIYSSCLSARTNRHYLFRSVFQAVV